MLNPGRRTKITSQLKTWGYLLWTTKGLWVRAVLCLLIGWLTLWVDETNSFDLRFQMRGQRAVSDQIVVIKFSRQELLSHAQLRRTPKHSSQFAHQSANETDFWETRVWQKILSKINDAQPRAVGISFVFRKDLITEKVSPQMDKVFRNPKIFWSSYQDEEGHLHLPFFGSKSLHNTGLAQLIPDPDGKVRRLKVPQAEDAHLAYALTSQPSPPVGTQQLINFAGPAGHFKSYTIDDILFDRLPPQALKGRIVIIGARATPAHIFNTPVGPMSRAEILAHLVENILFDHWIKRLDHNWYRIFLLLLLLLAVWIVFRYPQTVAFIFLAWIATANTALSLWVFDSFNLWIPAFSTMVMLFAIFVLFVTYQLALQERLHWKMTQESRSIQELEQLKNNFISLFSHDLKTPIAKMQAIIDRLTVTDTQSPLAQDLASLRSVSDELHRYIQKILQVSRVESRKFKIRKESDDLNLVTENAVNQLKPLAHEKQIRLKQEFEPLFSVEMDSSLIHEVIVNFLDNAIKFTPAGGTVTIKTDETERGVRVQVIDTGTGISPDEQKKIWHKFVRGSQHATRVQGTGLGLYLSKYFVELHGGDVGIKSELGQGTNSWFLIPFESAQKHTSQEALAVPEDVSPIQLIRWELQ